LSLAVGADGAAVGALSAFGKGEGGFTTRIQEIPKGAAFGFMSSAPVPIAVSKLYQGTMSVLTPTAVAQVRQHAHDRVMDALIRRGPWSNKRVYDQVWLQKAIDLKRGPALIAKLKPRQQHKQQLDYLKHIDRAAGYVQPFGDVVRDLLTKKMK
jgi:hypothetical protein